jgi:hypothetical protein
MSVLSLAVTSSVSFAAENLNTEVERASQQLGAQGASEIKFDQGKTDLKPDEVAELRELIQQAKSGGQKIEEIKIVAWADREYPAKGTTAPNQQVKLADERADKIKKFVKDDLKIDDVEVYNMAKRPNALQDIFETKTAELKKSMEGTGAAPTTGEGTGLFGMKSKISEALVLVYTEKK